MSNSAMTDVVRIRPVDKRDYAGWRPLWDGYNQYYGRHGSESLPEGITESTWERFFSDSEPMHCVVAEIDRGIVGIAHFLYHRSTTRMNDVCYLQDLFTIEERRGQGIGRKLIHAVYESARVAGSSRVYWQTKATNAAGRALYDKVAEHLGFVVYSHDL